MKPLGNTELRSDSYCLDGKEYMEWVPIDELARRKVFPTFFAEKLKNIPLTAEVVTTVD